MKKSIMAVALTAAGAVACGVISPVAHTASAAPFSSSSSGSSSSPGNSGGPHTPWAPDVSDGLIVNLIGDILGRGISDHVGVMTGDLGTMTPIGDGGEFAIIFGDSFRGANFGEGEWMSPVGVVAEVGPDGRIVIKRALNDGDRVEQLINYRHNDRGLTLIPSDIINVDGTLYMQGMWNEGIGNVLRTQIWKSTNQGATWQSVTTIPSTYKDGMLNLISWDQGPDGYIYMASSSFKRRDDVYLTRFRPEDIGNHSAWRHYRIDENGEGTWSTNEGPILDDRVRAGEMSLRYIDGHWVLAMFNAETMAIEVRISEQIARDWNEIEPANVVVAGFGGWREEQTPSNFTQLYGGYIVPGSSLSNMDLVVSQWNTGTNRRYMSTQFNVKGLDAFFGINTGGPSAQTLSPLGSRVGDQSVITVEEKPVDGSAQDRLGLEQMMEEATELIIVPLDSNDPLIDAPETN